jgi:hypothetical protein
MTPAQQVGVSLGVAMVGVLTGWGASSLTLAGRVEAIERSQERMEAKVTALILKAGLDPLSFDGPVMRPGPALATAPAGPGLRVKP